MLQREDFDNDKVDAGDVGSGQTVTALYEIVPVGGPRANGDLRYSRPVVQALENHGIEYGFVKIRYKQPNSDRSQLHHHGDRHDVEGAQLRRGAARCALATGVATFAELLRGGRYSGSMTYDDVLQVVSARKGDDEFGYRTEFIQLVRAARTASAMARLER
jgi:Ca-activated chloride channel family protein